MTATHVNHQGTGRRRAIGSLGTTARVLIVDQAAAERARFPGSPTVRPAGHTGHS
jgi:hypothetical protein